MPRYIDADKLKERTMMLGLEQRKIEFAVFLCKYIDTEPPADVVPKSESLPLDVHEALKQRAVEKAKAEVAREIFEEIEEYSELVVGGKVIYWNTLAELKKKYTEENHGTRREV